MAGLAEHSSSSAARTMRTTSSLVLHGKRRPKNVICATPSELAKRPDPFFSPYPPDGFEDKYGRFANDIREIIELKRKINGDAFSFLLSYGKNKSTIEENMAKEPPITIFDSDDELSEIVASVSDSATNRNAKVVDRGNRVKLEFGDDLIFLGELHYNEAKSSQNRGLEQSEVDEEVILVDENDSEDSERDRNCSDEIESPQNDEEDDDDADSDSDDGNPQVGDGLDHIWSQMAFELESSKPAVENPWGKPREEEKVEDCEHSFIYKEDIGEVCRVCGLVRIPVESIIEVMFNKPKRSRTYVHDPKNFKNGETTDPLSSRSSREDSLATVLSVHPMHQKQMRPHQIHGFNFLCDNLVSDSPGGCILAHTPGSGKTFLLISFIQSFMAMHPHAKPLIVLPKGVIETWKKEFIRWAVETFPLLDFYSEKADSRAQQLIVLRKWIKQRSILFLGYQQFSSIICDFKNNDASEECQRILLKEPTLLILDEGHTSRNDETDVLNSLDRVETPRKVVLTGTLFQNHVKEVFNILNLVRPKFLRLPESQVFVRRIMSKIEPLSGKRNSPSFCAGVEETLKNRNKSSAKASVIKDLREMTRSVLHYHKADFSDELPGLIDFTVMLNLSAKQRDEVKKLEKEHNFKQMSAGAALYIHPKLKAFSDRYLSHGGDRAWGFDNDKIDEMLQNIDVQEGVKLKFFLNILNLCETRSEKLLVFSQFVFPLKTLERLLRETKGWHLGKEMFTLTGESSNEQRQWSIERFNTSGEAKVFFGSIKACGEGVSLVGASRVLILDVHLNPSVTQQAVARAYRPGQKKKVYAYRLVAADSAEEGDYKRCSEKEFISKMWFEWNVGWGHGDFEFRAVEVDNCDDDFLETPRLREDIKALYIR